MVIAAAPHRSHRIIKPVPKSVGKIDAGVGVGRCARTGATTGRITETGITMGAGVAEEGRAVVIALTVATIDAKRDAKTGTTTVNNSCLGK
jgi:hypothetical protein